MNTADVAAAFDLPASAHVDHRVPKTPLVANSAPNSADKYRINKGVEAIH